MRKARWLADDNGKNGSKEVPVSKPAIYHCISRVVDRRFVFGEKECGVFRMHMRMYENFSSCRILSYCLMTSYCDATTKNRTLQDPLNLMEMPGL